MIQFDEDIVTEECAKIPVCLTIYEEMNTSESETESDESVVEEIRDGVDKLRVACGEHSSLIRLGQKMDGDKRKERKISVKNGERKVSIKNVKVIKILKIKLKSNYSIFAVLP